MNDDLFIKEIKFRRDKVEDLNEYPFNIDLIKKFNNLELDSPVTFLVGENGVGKSTFMEALAVACGINPEGGSQNFMFSTRDTHSELGNYLEINHFQRKAVTKYFLRAESFYNVITEIENLHVGSGYGKRNLHECSHGESFIQLFQNRFTHDGLYLLDEPESALSPSRQMTLLCLIDELVKSGSQFIIATHSPILISYYKGKILDLNNNFKVIDYEETEIYNLYKLFLNNYESMQRNLFLEGDD